VASAGRSSPSANVFPAGSYQLPLLLGTPMIRKPQQDRGSMMMILVGQILLHRVVSFSLADSCRLLILPLLGSLGSRSRQRSGLLDLDIVRLTRRTRVSSVAYRYDRAFDAPEGDDLVAVLQFGQHFLLLGSSGAAWQEQQEIKKMAKMRMMGRKLSGELAAANAGLKKSQNQNALSLEGNRPNLTPVGTTRYAWNPSIQENST